MRSNTIGMGIFKYTGITIFIIFFKSMLISADCADFDPYFHSITAKSGDGIIVLMQRYGLDGYECNYNTFVEINGLRRGAPLYAEKSYKLPIKIYHYNGRSIRSTIGNNDLDKAKRIQTYNEEVLRKGLRISSYTESKILWVPMHELDCAGEAIEIVSEVASLTSKAISSDEKKEVEAIPPAKNVTSKYSTNDLFGSKYADFEIFDNSLKNKVFYISSGHGGPDPGAMCTDCSSDMCEDEYAYDVCLRLARNLMQHGAIVHMIIQDNNDGIRDEKYLDCDNDELTYNGKKLPLRQLDRLKQRADAINHLYHKYKKEGIKEQKAIMVHVDSRAKEKRQDVFFYYYDQNKGGEDLAKKVFYTFESKYAQHRKDGDYKGYVDSRGLYMLRKVVPSAVYVELANIRNVSDHKRIIYDYNRQALANWLFEGLTKE